MNMKLGKSGTYTNLPVRTRVGGGGRPQSEFVRVIAALEPNEYQDIEFVADESYPNTPEGFKKFTSTISTKVSNGVTQGTIPFECRVTPMPEDNVVRIFRLDGEAASVSRTRREKYRATLAAKKNK